jgi:hypothetical protein
VEHVHLDLCEAAAPFVGDAGRYHRSIIAFASSGGCERKVAGGRRGFRRVSGFWNLGRSGELPACDAAVVMNTLASGISHVDLGFLGTPHVTATAVLHGRSGDGSILKCSGWDFVRWALDAIRQRSLGLLK